MTVDVNMQQEKEKLAREWLANLKPLLGLDKADDEKSNNKKTKKTSSSSSSSMKKSAAALGRGGNKYADVSDDDDEEGGRKRGGAGGDKENIVKRHKDAFVKEAIDLMDIWFAGDNGDKQEKEELERVKHVLRKVRSDPPIAPDEPVPITLRPFDVKPGDESRSGWCELNWFDP